MINCRRIREKISSKRTRNVRVTSLTEPCGPHLTNRPAIILFFLLYRRASLFLFFSPTRYISRPFFHFRVAPVRRYSHSFAIPVDLCRLFTLSISLPLSFSLSPLLSFFLSFSLSLASILRPSFYSAPPIALEFRSASIAKSRLFSKM